MNRRFFFRALPALPLAVIANGVEHGRAVSIHGRAMNETRALDIGLKNDRGEPVAVLTMPIKPED